METDTYGHFVRVEITKPEKPGEIWQARAVQYNGKSVSVSSFTAPTSGEILAILNKYMGGE